MADTTMQAPTVPVKSYLQFVELASLTNWSVRFALETKFNYNPTYPLQRLGSFLRRNKTEVIIKDNVEYRRVTIRMNNRGVLLRDKELGQNIGTKRQFRLSAGQFVLSKIDARNGAMGIAPLELDGATITADFLAFDVDNSLINPYFLALVTSTNEFISFCQSCSSGTTNRQRIDENLFLNVQIPLPSLNEQAQLISEYQSRIQQAQAKREEINNIESTLSHYLDSEFGVSTVKREQLKGLVIVESKDLERWGFEFATAVVRSNVTPRYPQKQIKEICKVSSGGTPSRSIPAYYEGGSIPWVKTTEVVNSVIYATEECITETALKNSSARLYQPGSLIVAMYGQGATRGRTAKLGIEASTNQACAVLYDIKTSLVSTDFLWVYLMNEYERLREMASGNNQPNLNAGMINSYKVQIPTLEKQQEIVDTFFLMQERIQQSRRDAETLETEAVAEFEQAIFETNIERRIK